MLDVSKRTELDPNERISQILNFKEMCDRLLGLIPRGFMLPWAEFAVDDKILRFSWLEHPSSASSCSCCLDFSASVSRNLVLTCKAIYSECDQPSDPDEADLVGDPDLIREAGGVSAHLGNN